ncbi:MAG: hypothetical protein VB102_04810 [Paludibacter sp.]|nr:hypothetical protein [Paludibacter sp.]
MKKILIILAVQTAIFSSCEKQEVTSLTRHKTDKDLIVTNAIKLSEQHDSLLIRLLSKEKQFARQKMKSSTQSARLEMMEVFDVVENVTGIRPYVVGSSDDIKQMSKANGNNDEVPVINFDENYINLSGYTNSTAMGKYLAHVDTVLQDSLLSVSGKISQISLIQDEVKSDPFLSLVEFENFYNTTEVLKGSMALWNNQYDEISEMQHINSMYKAKPIKQWSFFAKLAFVAAADAVGAVLGTFIGGFLIVNGVPIYIPSGPQGACVGLATLSLIAGNMVGW